MFKKAEEVLGCVEKVLRKAQKAQKSAFQPENDVLMSSDEECQRRLSPSATMLARRASREVMPMCEESSSDADAEEPESLFPPPPPHTQHTLSLQYYLYLPSQ